jgi:uncharacterized protein
MNKAKVVKLTATHVKDKMLGEGTGHDWWHVYRVWQNAKRIAGYDKDADLYIVQLGALLHDISDWKFSGGDEDAGAREARKWLEGLHVDKDTIDDVCHIVKNVSFRGAGVKNTMRLEEGLIVQDADRLDAIGAIGIARTFAYGGKVGNPMYDPHIKPMHHKSFASYKKNRSTTINHFYEKLLLLRGRMNTRGGRALAKGRDSYMKNYLKQFYSEWNGKM